jgi:hypothetical protein
MGNTGDALHLPPAVEAQTLKLHINYGSRVLWPQSKGAGDLPRRQRRTVDTGALAM